MTSLRERRLSTMERVLKLAEPVVPREEGEDMGAYYMRLMQWWKDLPPDHELKQQMARETAERQQAEQ